METIELRYRTWFSGTAPQPIKLQIPGWSGEPGYSDGCEPQPWHCKPFVDGSTYGLELIYPFTYPCIVKTHQDETITFESEFTEKEKATGSMPPFMSFAPHHYGFTSSLDLKTPKDIITRIEPHPSFYTDRTGTIPIPVAGHLETEWWSRVFFIAFKSPLPGQYHVFKPGEPYVQLLFLPKTIAYHVIPMTLEEITERTNRDDHLGKNGAKLCNHHYNDYKGHRFNNTYKVLSKINNRDGISGVDDYIDKTLDKKIPTSKKIPGFSIKKK